MFNLSVKRLKHLHYGVVLRDSGFGFVIIWQLVPRYNKGSPYTNFVQGDATSNEEPPFTNKLQGSTSCSVTLLLLISGHLFQVKQKVQGDPLFRDKWLSNEGSRQQQPLIAPSPGPPLNWISRVWCQNVTRSSGELRQGRLTEGTFYCVYLLLWLLVI